MAGDLRVIVCCGTSAVTSTVMMNRIQTLAKSAGLKVKVYKCIGAELASKTKLYRPNLIVTTLHLSSDYGVPLFSGVPYLTGIGADELDAKILETLTQAQQQGSQSE
jgi:PTS system galactitol-specific IIB component